MTADYQSPELLASVQPASELSRLIGLPDWIDPNDLETLATHEIAVMSVTHGNEHHWDKIVQPRQQYPRGDGLLPIRANPRAAEINERFVDENLGRCFGRLQSPNSNHETRVAQALEFILGAMPEGSIKIDGHSGGADFFDIYQAAPPEVYAAGRLFGFRNAIVTASWPFLKTVAGSMNAEMTTDSLSFTSVDDQQQIEKFDRGLDEIVALGRHGLRDLFFDEGIEDVEFYALAPEISLLNPDGTPNTEVRHPRQSRGLNELGCLKGNAAANLVVFR